VNALMACRRASSRCRAQVMEVFAAASVSELDRGRPRPRRGVPGAPTHESGWGGGGGPAPPGPPPGATSVEYALMAGLIALVIVVSVTLFGTNVITLFNVPSSVFNP
jgi:Flp pilus assembly pilin Flp